MACTSMYTVLGAACRGLHRPAAQAARRAVRQVAVARTQHRTATTSRGEPVNTNDTLLRMAGHPLGSKLLRAGGLPTPPALRRSADAFTQPPLAGASVALLACAGSGAAAPSGVVEEALMAAGATVVAGTGAGGGTGAPRCMVIDATAVAAPSELTAVFQAAQASMERGGPLAQRSARIVVVGADPADAESVGGASAAAALQGFHRSLAKEVGRLGSTVNLVTVSTRGWDASADDARARAATSLASPLGFFLSDHSAFVTGQALTAELAHGAPEGSLQDKVWLRRLLGINAAAVLPV